jgi:hypothetical protein
MKVGSVCFKPIAFFDAADSVLQESHHITGFSAFFNPTKNVN